jgi:cellulose synthase/poly-beta-1,6-N-acetylglucosamine synthase-like glycosyltransferase
MAMDSNAPFWIFLSTYGVSLAVDLGRTLIEAFIHIAGTPRQKQTFSEHEIAVIIPCHNSQWVIARTILSIPKQYTIICVANGCTDKTTMALACVSLKRPNLKVVETPEGGKIRAVLLGASHAKKLGFSHFILLDDDIVWPSTHPDIETYDKEKPITALPVVPIEGRGFLNAGQVLEYQMMCISKGAQAYLGNVVMASGAAGIYRLDTFLECMEDHDGEHIGDDLQCCYIHHAHQKPIDFFDEIVIQTDVPATFKALWKQRARRWEISPIHNWYWVLRVLITKDLGLWLKTIVGYRVFVFANDIVRLITLPFILFQSPKIFLGVCFIAYLGIAIRALVHRAFFSGYYDASPKANPFSPERMLMYPVYMFLMWVMRLYAIPLGFRQIYRYWVLGKRKTSSLKTFIHHLERNSA